MFNVVHIFSAVRPPAHSAESTTGRIHFSSSAFIRADCSWDRLADPLDEFVKRKHAADGWADNYIYLATPLGFPALWTRNENPIPFSNGSTVAVTSRTGYLTVASP
jgi:hypothetical protein